MAALAYLLNLGFAANLSGKSVRLSAASKLNAQMCVHIKSHRFELLAERASNDVIEHLCQWQAQYVKRLGTMIGDIVH